MAGSSTAQPTQSFANSDDSKWIEALGELASCEKQRLIDFDDLAARMKRVLAVERHRVVSAQQLISAVRQHINDRAGADEEVARRLMKAANKSELVASKGRATSAWLDEDWTDACYLLELQRHSARVVEDGAKSLRELEGCEKMKRWENLGRAAERDVTIVERTLKVAEASSLKCKTSWERHANLCRRILQPSAAKSANSARDGTDLWASEMEYRRTVTTFITDSENCSKQIKSLFESSGSMTLENRSLAREIIVDITRQGSIAASSLAQALTPLANNALPQIPGISSPPEVVQTEKTLPAQLAFNPPSLPKSGLVAHHGAIERPPKGGKLNPFGRRQAHLVVTISGHVYCYESFDDIRTPVWSMEPKIGASLITSHDEKKLTFIPAAIWPLNIRTSHTRHAFLASAEQTSMWESVLRQWWSAPEDSAVVAKAIGSELEAEEADQEGQEQSEANLAKMITKTDGKYILQAGMAIREGQYTFDISAGVLKVDSDPVGHFSCDQMSAMPLDIDLNSAANSVMLCINVQDSDLMTEIQKESNEGAYFVIPSQLNGAEYPDPQTIIKKLQDYKQDNMDGTCGQLAVHPAVAQFILDNAANQDNAGQGINAIDVVLKRTGGFDVVNGFLKMPLPNGTEDADQAYHHFVSNLHMLRRLVMTEVQACGLNPSKTEFSSTSHKVNLVYASAVPFNAYPNAQGTNEQEKFHLKVAEAVLVAQYYGALKAAASAAKHEKITIFLTPLGGGVLNNPLESVAKSMALAVEMLTAEEHAKLVIKAFASGGNPSDKQLLETLLDQEHNKLLHNNLVSDDHEEGYSDSSRPIAPAMPSGDGSPDASEFASRSDSAQTSDAC